MPAFDAPQPAHDLFSRISAAGGQVTNVVNNPVAEETETSLRKIGMKRTYLGANSGEPTPVRKISEARRQILTGDKRKALKDSGRRSGRFFVG